MWAKKIEGQNAFAPALCWNKSVTVRKFHVTDGQNMRDQIRSDRRSKRA